MLAACATYPAPVTTAQACGTYGYVDADNDGVVTSAEWDAYRTGSYSYWDTDHDGRISRSEFGLVGVDTAQAQPSAAAGGSAAPKKPE
jgi:hypothetical protein